LLQKLFQENLVNTAAEAVVMVAEVLMQLTVMVEVADTEVVVMGVAAIMGVEDTVAEVDMEAVMEVEVTGAVVMGVEAVMEVEVTVVVEDMEVVTVVEDMVAEEDTGMVQVVDMMITGVRMKILRTLKYLTRFLSIRTPRINSP
jgi:hypothetical protein